MKKILKNLIEILRRTRKYWLTAGLLCIALIPDLIYHFCPAWWALGVKPLGVFCTWIQSMGFHYKDALATLKSNFGILVSAISIIITLSVNNLNRFENKLFGLKRFEFEPTRLLSVYQYGRRIVLLAPLVMFFAVCADFCLLGYGTLLACYLFLIASYFLFESNFRQEKNLDHIVAKLWENVPPDVQDQEDAAAYRMLLNIMRQWNEKEKDWEDVDYLFLHLCERTENDALSKTYILRCCFYEMMYVRNHETESIQAVQGLKKYIRQQDGQGWKEKDFLILWGMLHCLFSHNDKRNLLLFFKWYMDFAGRSAHLIRTGSLKEHNGGGVKGGISSQVMRMQTGLLLIEIESYFARYADLAEVDSYIVKKLPQLWNNGKSILEEKMESFFQKFLILNMLYDLETDQIIRHLENLYSDYQYGTTKSLVVFRLKYEPRQETSNGNNM